MSASKIQGMMKTLRKRNASLFVCSLARCFLRHPDRSLNFQVIFTMDLKMNDSARPLSSTFSVSNRFHPEKKEAYYPLWVDCRSNSWEGVPFSVAK